MGRCKKIGTSNIALIKKFLLCNFLFLFNKYYQYILGKIQYKYYVKSRDHHRNYYKHQIRHQ
jgi:hypothetical protein